MIELFVILILGISLNVVLRWSEDDLIFDVRNYAKSIDFNEKLNDKLAVKKLTDKEIDNFIKKITKRT